MEYHGTVPLPVCTAIKSPRTLTLSSVAVLHISAVYWSAPCFLCPISIN